MNLRMFLAGLMFVFLARPVFATPPSAVSLNYDVESKNLHLTAAHPSGRLDRHYLRRLVVYVNGEEADSKYYPRQTLAWGLEDDIPFEGEPGDKISVEIFCSQGGIGKAETLVPELPQENVPQK